MLITGLLAGVEAGLNRVLRLDGTALPRLQSLSGKVIVVQCQSPALELYIPVSYTHLDVYKRQNQECSTGPGQQEIPGR